jgi:asparagine N-glycosylation enzyme membrane subunit Stt3
LPVLGIIVILSCILTAIHWSSISLLFSQSIYELKSFDITGLFLYVPLTLPLGYGIFILYREKPQHGKLLLSMLLFNLFLSIVMSRLQLFLIAPVCIVSGIGMWRFYADTKNEVLTEKSRRA